MVIVHEATFIYSQLGEIGSLIPIALIKAETDVAEFAPGGGRSKYDFPNIRFLDDLVRDLNISSIRESDFT